MSLVTKCNTLIYFSVRRYHGSFYIFVKVSVHDVAQFEASRRKVSDEIREKLTVFQCVQFLLGVSKIVTC